MAGHCSPLNFVSTITNPTAAELTHGHHHQVASAANVFSSTTVELDKLASVKALYDTVRSNFPFFDPMLRNPIFMENAGGSQCPRVVIDAISKYMKYSYVQLGASYALSIRAEETVSSAHDYMKTFMNAHGIGEVIFGPSTSQLMATLSNCYSDVLSSPGTEVIVHEAAHEANVGPWLRMAARKGFSVKCWNVDYDNFESSLKQLEELLSPRTKIVAVAHVSNLLGEILDLQKVVNLVKSKAGKDVRVITDGVAFAPHRVVDVAKWGVDWYVFSTYKVYGPHMAVLFGTQEALMDVESRAPNHDFVQSLPSKFEVGCINHEACAGIVALQQYFGKLARVEKTLPNQALQYLRDWESVNFGEMSLIGIEEMSSTLDRVALEAAYETIILLEQPLQKMLLDYLGTREDVIILGPKSWSSRLRVPTISFFHKYKTSSEICRALQKAGFAVRNGHMYCFRLVSGLVSRNKLTVNTVDDGVVRISMVHYNTPMEVGQLITSLQAIL